MIVTFVNFIWKENNIFKKKKLCYTNRNALNKTDLSTVLATKMTLVGEKHQCSLSTGIGALIFWCSDVSTVGVLVLLDFSLF